MTPNKRPITKQQLHSLLCSPLPEFREYGLKLLASSLKPADEQQAVPAPVKDKVE